MQGDKTTGTCCPHGSWPALKSNYVAQGQKITLGDYDVYHMGQGNKVLVIISDIFGAQSGRHQAVADTYSSLGYNVYLPHLLAKPYEGAMQMGPILDNIKAQPFDQLRNRFVELLKLLERNAINRFYCVGFCWGVWAAFKFATEFKQIGSIAGMHPSLGVEQLFGGQELELVKKINCPAFFYPAGNDPENIKKGGVLVEELVNKFGVEKVGTIDFPQMQHGWVVRGDLSDQKVHRDVEKAIGLSHEYFSKFNL